MRTVLIVVAVVALALGTFGILSPKEKTMPEQGPLQLSTSEKTELLSLARSALTAELTGGEPPSPDPAKLPPDLLETAPCFVTLTEHGTLRGCILDSFVPHEAVYLNVMRNAVLAATIDTRFAPVRTSELEDLSIEISILGPSYPLAYQTPSEILSLLRPGVDGVILTTTYGRSTFLPQVWEELSDPEEFLFELCRKQGAPGDCWRTDALLGVEVYQVNHFAESDSEGSAADGH
jgi:AmmeMemoRadiSam system protein A